MPGEFTVYFDGASKGNPGPAGIGAVILDSTGERHEIRRFIGGATNNQAEYTALLEALKAAKDLGATRVRVFSDSELVVRQLNGEYRIKDPKLRILYDEVVRLCRGFEKISFAHVPREENKEADALANQAVKEQRKEESAEWVEFSVSSRKAVSLLEEFVELLTLAQPAQNPVFFLPDKSGTIRVRLRRNGRELQAKW